MSDEHTRILARIAEHINIHVPREICTTEDGVRWLVTQYESSKKALRDLEQIRTERLASMGLAAEASAVSRARVNLQGHQ